MKNHLLKLSKMQRKVRARRKTWTNKERYENRLKNAARLGRIFNQGQRLAEQFIAEAEQELAQEAAQIDNDIEMKSRCMHDHLAEKLVESHVHSDNCTHDHHHEE